MLSAGQRDALSRTLASEVIMTKDPMKRDWVSFIGCRREDIDDVLKAAAEANFHLVDVELFRDRRVTTEEFCQLIELDKYQRFTFLLPRKLPFSVCYFLYNLADHSVVSTDDYNPWERGVPFSQKAMVLLMSVDDWEDLKFETGWDRSKLDRVIRRYCWIHDSRYD